MSSVSLRINELDNLLKLFPEQNEVCLGPILAREFASNECAQIMRYTLSTKRGRCTWTTLTSISRRARNPSLAFENVDAKFKPTEEKIMKLRLILIAVLRAASRGGDDILKPFVFSIDEFDLSEQLTLRSKTDIDLDYFVEIRQKSEKTAYQPPA